MSDEKELNPLTDKEFGDFLEGLGDHLEHEAFLKCWNALGFGHEFIRNLIIAQIARGSIKKVPDKVESLLSIMKEAIDMGKPFVEDTKSHE